MGSRVKYIVGKPGVDKKAGSTTPTRKTTLGEKRTRVLPRMVKLKKEDKVISAKNPGVTLESVDRRAYVDFMAPNTTTILTALGYDGIAVKRKLRETSDAISVQDSNTYRKRSENSFIEQMNKRKRKETETPSSTENKEDQTSSTESIVRKRKETETPSSTKNVKRMKDTNLKQFFTALP